MMGEKAGLKKSTLKKDLKGADVPFDLFTGLSLVVDEIESKGFVYSHLTKEKNILLVYTSKEAKENISINIEKENLLIRQFMMTGTNRKLKVIYVVKPTERTFKLV